VVVKDAEVDALVTTVKALLVEVIDLTITVAANFMESQPNNPLHGVKLEQILIALEAHYGWEVMGEKINIRCFTDGPTLKSSLKFLRRTPWARTKVENLYLKFLKTK